MLTCRLSPSPDWGPYDAAGVESLVRTLGIRRDIVELGLLPYAQLANLYRACDIYASPAYAESFAHPLVEAMACGLPVAASDLPVHREVCGAAARYFPRFSPEALADCIAEIAHSKDTASAMSARGLGRAQDFSWDKHVRGLLAAAASMLAQPVDTRRASGCSSPQQAGG